MGSVLVTNATVVTMDAQRRVIPNGAVGVHNGTIAAVGDAGQVAAQGTWDEVIDASGSAVMPGFINSHTHGCMPFGRTIGYDRAFDSWLPGTQLPTVADALLQAGEDVVFLGAESLAASLGATRAELGMQNNLDQVLAVWDGPGAIHPRHLTVLRAVLRRAPTVWPGQSPATPSYRRLKVRRPR
jgi:cytosine/adenosine deaminase-related metal-dependent hydrolase